MSWPSATTHTCSCPSTRWRDSFTPPRGGQRRSAPRHLRHADHLSSAAVSRHVGGCGSLLTRRTFEKAVWPKERPAPLRWDLVPADYADQIRRLRRGLGLTQGQFAACVGAARKAGRLPVGVPKALSVPAVPATDSGPQRRNQRSVTKPSADTSRPPLPNVRFCMNISLLADARAS